MIKFIKNLALSLLITLFSAMVILLIVTLLGEKGVISPKVNDYMINAIGAILFLLLGFLFGKRQKTRGFWWGLFLGCLYLGGALTYRLVSKTGTPLNISMLSLKSLMILIGCILGVNRSHHKEVTSA